MNAHRTAQRVRRLEDVEAIKTLTARYANAINRTPDHAQVDIGTVRAILTSDARWSSADFGVVAGADAIIDALPAATAGVPLAMHAFVNPTITVDADTGTGRWALWIASIFDGRPGTVHMAAEMTYARTEAGWRIRTIHIGRGFRICGVP